MAKIIISIYFLVFTWLVTSTVAAVEITGLKMVQILFRHGDRYPIYTYPQDPYRHSEIFSKKNVGQLTNVGKRQHYAFGRFLRDRYQSFISNKYMPDELLVLSSDTDRTIMSAQMNMAGLFEPVNLTRNWNKTLYWQPVPIRTLGKDEDKFLSMHKPCPIMGRLDHEIQNTLEFKQKMEQYRNFLQDLKRDIGFQGEMTMKEAVKILDTLLIEEQHHYKLPRWAQGRLEILKELSGLSTFFRTFTTKSKRLRAGPLLHKILHGFAETSLKLVIYSAHDSTLGRLMGALEIFNMVPVPFASALIFELRENPHGDILQIFWKNDTNHEPYEMTIPNCSSPCRFDRFVRVTEHLIPENWEEECAVPRLNAAPPVLPMFLVMGILFGAVTALILGMVMVMARRRTQTTRPFPRIWKNFHYESI